MTTKDWRNVSREKPCLICDHADWCRLSADGAVALCGRISEGSFQEAKNGGGWFHRLIESPRSAPATGRPRSNGRAHQNGAARSASAPGERMNWKAVDERLQGAMTEARFAQLADATGVPAAAWGALSPGWADATALAELHAGGAGWQDSPVDGAWSFAERDGEGRIVGISFRAVDGRKGAAGGGKRGLSVPTNLHKLPDPVLIVEGASDVAACGVLGLPAVGRPNNRGGAEDAANMLDGRDVLVVGERDGKPGGAWPGRDGAKAVAGRLAGRWGEPVAWTLPPLEIKDIRAYVQSKVTAGLNLADAASMKAAGAELLTALQAAAKEIKPVKRTQADALVDLAREHYRLGKSTDGEAFAVPVNGPAVAMMFRGGGSGLRAALAKAFRERTGKTPSASALADALCALEGMAQDAQAEPLALRVAEHDGGIVLDLADATGRVVVVTAGGWAVEAVSPVLFRRTALTAALPMPAQAEPKDLSELRELLNVDDATWPLVVGWLIAAAVAGIPHPVLMLGGEQGTGKSSAARMVLGLVDPSAAPLRSEPRDAEQWAIAASGSWAVCLDNVSHISGWLSDAICKAVTGDGLVRRKLYTDSDLAVLSFKRCIMLTSIDHGALRGDLGDRLLLADLERIPDERRRTEAELEAAYCTLRPRLLGALLSTLARTLAALPGVTLVTMPRMADFARVLAALDAACPELTGGRALALFAGQRHRIADEVIDGDAVAAAVVKLIDDGRWTGTAAELLSRITPERPPRGWPASARAMAGHLRRTVPALRAIGVQIDFGRRAGGNRARIIEIEKGAEPPSQPSHTVPDSPGSAENANAAGRSGRDRDEAGRSQLPERPAETVGNSDNGDGGDGRDGQSPPTSMSEREEVEL